MREKASSSSTTTTSRLGLVAERAPGREGVVRGISKLKSEFRRSPFYSKIDFDGVHRGDPRAVLPVLHYVLLNSSRLVASFLKRKGYNLYTSTDKKFVELAYRIARNEFSYRPVLTLKQFLTDGYAERKIFFLCDLIKLCQRKHSEILRLRKQAQLKSAEGREGQKPHELDRKSSYSPPLAPTRIISKDDTRTATTRSVSAPPARPRITRNEPIRIGVNASLGSSSNFKKKSAVAMGDCWQERWVIPQPQPNHHASSEKNRKTLKATIPVSPPSRSASQAITGRSFSGLRLSSSPVSLERTSGGRGVAAAAAPPPHARHGSNNSPTASSSLSPAMDSNSNSSSYSSSSFSSPQSPSRSINETGRGAVKSPSFYGNASSEVPASKKSATGNKYQEQPPSHQVPQEWPQSRSSSSPPLSPQKEIVARPRLARADAKKREEKERPPATTSAETNAGVNPSAPAPADGPGDISIVKLLRELATIPQRMDSLEKAMRSVAENVGERLASLENKLRLLESLD